MTWFKSVVAAAAIFAVASAPLGSSFALVAAAQETLEDLAGRDRGEVAALPDDQQLDAEELDTLVAPVALYPDALLAQVLVAATYPLQIVKADRLLDETDGLPDDEVAQLIAEQDWDPSVMVLLSGFPTVVQRMADDLDWTEQLGTAMVGQDQDVLAAVQRMRTQAFDTGWLKSNQAQVVERSDEMVAIRPTDPDVVYVPSYDSSLAFTSPPTAQPYVAPSSSPLANPVVAGAMAFGAALLIQQLFKDDDDDEDRSWNDYWRRSEPFDWRDRQFYPRPGRGWQHSGDGYAWGRERDDHWDRGRGGWSYDARARAERERERRAAVAWTSRPGAEGLSRIGDLRTVARERPAPKPKPAKAVAKPKPKPEAKPAKAAAKPKPKPEAKPAKAAAKPKPKPEAKPAKAVAKPKPKPDAKPAKAAAKPKPKPEATPAKAAAKPKPKPEAKPAKAAAKPKPKPEAKPAKAAAKPKPKPEAKPAKVAKAAAKPKPKAKATAKPGGATAKQRTPERKVAKAKPAPKPPAKAKAAKTKPPAKKKAACKPGTAACRR